MHGYVFKLYERGQRLGCPAGPATGDLVMKKREDGTGDVIVKVIGANERQLPPLHFARVEAIAPSGLVIKGMEIIARRTNNKANADRHRQVWWAMTDVRAVEGIRLVQLEHDLDRLARQRGALEYEAAMSGWNVVSKAEFERLAALAGEHSKEAEAIREKHRSQDSAL